MADGVGADDAVMRAAAAHRNRVHQSLLAAITLIGTDVPTATLRHRAQLLLTATIGIGLAARGGASSDEVARMIFGVKHEIRSWTRP